jgi:hypothetical protein
MILLYLIFLKHILHKDKKRKKQLHWIISPLNASYLPRNALINIDKLLYPDLDHNKKNLKILTTANNMPRLDEQVYLL